MQHRHSYYLPLALVLLAGLIISLVPSSPALGSSLSPGSIVQHPANSPNLAPSSLITYTHTFIVNSSGSPTQNGADLLDAMTLIANSNPSASNPYLLKLEPGQYDLDNQALTLLPYVDLEGSGENITVISSTIGNSSYPPTTGTLVAASNTETRFLTILNSDSASNHVAVYTHYTANVNFIHLTSIASGSNSSSIFNDGGAITVRDSKITSSASGNGDSIGLNNYGGTVTVLNSNISTSTAGSGTGGGISSYRGTATVQSSNISASGSAHNYGIHNSLSTALTVQNSSISASGGNNNYGLYNYGLYDLGITGTVTLQSSIFNVSGGINSYGFYNDLGFTIIKVHSNTFNVSNSTNSHGFLNNGITTGIVTLQNSNFIASGDTNGYGLNSNSGHVQVGASQLSGTTAPSIATGTGSNICVASYKDDFTALGSNCL
jgi:hypothetical protein